jgi:hypothetical protein
MKDPTISVRGLVRTMVTRQGINLGQGPGLVRSVPPERRRIVVASAAKLQLWKFPFSYLGPRRFF